ncbi:MAG TPA: CorA family divalent cation transporter [Bacillota bacterium]|nr:CorA family divalent cation transporter [Bacillota bacterium]HPF42287.1 CorA family divalent cation transporter [Bacillota bacterium]HPJ86121.1 CorA family divalent cation transporter [Bacillota bacterium]HPQ61945.1 CorA family divalent cation transporter [Bacillota bacterium]HRX91955.1 CorA family divalent cation transporter [Candidatus Izemoplasmatales bacterium]
MRIREYVMPKSLIYTGEHPEVKTKIVHYQYDENKVEITDNFVSLPGKKHYIQVIGLKEIDKVKTIREFYSINPLILEDVFNVKQRTKVEMHDDFLFSSLHLEYQDGEEIKHDYLSIFMNKDALITFHETEPAYLAALPGLFQKNEELRKRGIDYLYYQILDIVTDNHLDIYDTLEKRANDFEEEILENEKIDQESFYLTRKQFLKLKEAVSPLMSELRVAMGSATAGLLFSKDTEPYFQDLRDHLQRLDDQLNTAREEIRHLLDLMMNNQSYKMNQIMTTLTLFSAIFIPLTFITGIFGMNFTYFGILDYKYAIPAFTAICVLLAVGMLIFFKRKKWF